MLKNRYLTKLNDKGLITDRGRVIDETKDAVLIHLYRSEGTPPVMKVVNKSDLSNWTLFTFYEQLSDMNEQFEAEKKSAEQQEAVSFEVLTDIEPEAPKPKKKTRSMSILEEQSLDVENKKVKASK
jgi:hypothetical protein